MARIIEVTELVLRDAQQSLLETSVAIEDLIPAGEDLDEAGYWSLECWGGASFDSCIRFLNEDPWERLRAYRKLLPHARLQMLLRGQNLLSYRNFDDSLVSRFVDKAAVNGIDVFRIYDALNDVRNLKTSVEAVRKAGKHAQGAICYAPTPTDSVSFFAETAQQLREMGCDSICIRDTGGLLKPKAAYDLVKGIKDKCGQDTMVAVHTHSTTGVTMVSLMKAIEAGCDIVDTAISSLAFGRGHNPTESLVEMLEGLGYETRLDMERLLRVKRHMTGVRPLYREFVKEPLGVETEIFASQIPAAMISTIACQLNGQGAGEFLPDVLAEVQNVRKDAGYPALVNPAGPIVGTQAIFNVLQGKYTVITSEFADLILGYYGRAVGEKNPEVLSAAASRVNKPAITCRPADLLEPEWPRLRSEAMLQSGCNGTDEDVLTYAMFPEVAPEFFRRRGDNKKVIAREPLTSAPTTSDQDFRGAVGPELASPVSYFVTINGKEHKVSIRPLKQ